MKVHEEHRVNTGVAPSNIEKLRIRVETLRVVGKQAKNAST